MTSADSPSVRAIGLRRTSASAPVYVAGGPGDTEQVAQALVDVHDHVALIQHQHAGDGRLDQAVQPLSLVAEVAHRGLLGGQQPVPLLLGPLAGGHVGEGDHEPAGIVGLIGQGRDGGVHPHQRAGVTLEAEIGTQFRPGRAGPVPLPADAGGVPGMDGVQPGGTEDVLRQAAILRAPALVDVRAPSRAVGARDADRGQLRQQPHLGLTRRERRVGPGQLGHIPGEVAEVGLATHHQRERGEFHGPFRPVPAQDGHVQPASELSRVLAAQELLGRLHEPGPVAFRDDQVPHALADHVGTPASVEFFSGRVELHDPALRVGHHHGIGDRVDHGVGDHPPLGEFPRVLDPADPGGDHRGQRPRGGLRLAGPLHPVGHEGQGTGRASARHPGHGEEDPVRRVFLLAG